MDGLPEGCIAHVLSFTSPRDACRLSCVSSSFRAAADSDALWDSFLPHDCLSRSSPPPPSFSSKKLLFLSLSRQPLLLDIDGALLSFWLHQSSSSGAKCFMLSPKSIDIVWGCTPRYWRWTWVPEGRFEEVAELVGVCWLEIRGRIATRFLSPSTLYSAFLVFTLTATSYGFQHQPVEVSLGIAGDAHTRLVCLDPDGAPQQQIVPRRPGHFNLRRLRDVPIPPPNLHLQYPNKRPDGWFEIELGDFFNQGMVDKELQMAVCEVKGGHWKSGLVIQGFEIRPKLHYK